tara:strand:+ start:213 stop:623 length:411 start_codon:yes stop_codon:yes gene_type:complete
MQMSRGLPVSNPFLEYLGVEMLSWEDGKCEFILKIEPKHLNRQAVVQGGVIATLLDLSCGYAGLRPDGKEEEAQHGVTITLTVNYLEATRAGHLRAVAKVTRSGRRIYFSAGEIFADDGTLVATAQGSFKRTNLRH